MAGGIQVDGNDTQAWVDGLLAQGLNSIQLTIYARQQAWNSPDLIFHEDGDRIIGDIRMAKDAGHERLVRFKLLVWKTWKDLG